MTAQAYSQSHDIGCVLMARTPKTTSLDFFRRQLSNTNALPQLSFLALLTGLATGGVILLFNAIMNWVLTNWVLHSSPEDFESLQSFGRMFLPCAGGLVNGLVMHRRQLRVGVVHVMERLSRHQGQLPLRNAMFQFFGGLIALITGQAGGREGPAIHLGAAASSLFGQWFELPNNSMRTLVACGTAAAIAGSFNTPIAGVIFAMEVVMMEYTISSFIPVIVAAVTATLLTHGVLGNVPTFSVPQVHLASLGEIPFIILAGVMIGCIAALYITLVQQFSRLHSWSFPMRGLVAGALTGVCALLTPEVMGIGYDTVNGALLGGIAITTLFLLVLTKSIASAACLGLGLPLGIIGPTIFIGASFGGVLGLLGQAIAPAGSSAPALYVMLGMCAMMGAVVQAPLAALMTVLELTANPNIILPAMLIIVVATLVTSEVFNKQSVFLTTLKALGLEYPPSPVTLHLQRAAVASIMQRGFVRLPAVTLPQDIEAALGRKPSWIVVEESSNTAHCLLNPRDLRAHLTELNPEEDESIDLLSIPGQRENVVNVDIRATLQEALSAMDKNGAQAACVRRTSIPLVAPIMGVFTRNDINNYRSS